MFQYSEVKREKMQEDGLSLLQDKDNRNLMTQQ